MSGKEKTESEIVDEASVRVYRLLSDGIESIGGIEVAAGICGTDRGDLRKGLDRNGRYIRVEHVIAIGARLSRFNATLVTRLGSALVEAFSLEVFPRVTLTDKERADRYERVLRQMPHGEQIVSDVLGGRL